MPNTQFNSTVNTTLQKTVYARRAFLYAQEQMYFDTKFKSTGDDSIITVQNDVKKGTGATMQNRLRSPLTGAGKADDAILEGFEESLAYSTFTATVHQRRHAVRVAGMSEFRSMLNVREDAKVALGDWMAQMQDTDTVLALSGLSNGVVNDEAVAVLAANAPSPNRYYVGGQTHVDYANPSALTAVANVGALAAATSRFGTLVISAMKRKAQIAGAGYPKIRPIRIKGKDWYVMFVHPWQLKDLKTDKVWLDAQLHAQTRGDDNPLFTGAEGHWDGVIIHSWDKIEIRVGANGTAGTERFEATSVANTVTAARALFCGAQAAVHNYGKQPAWEEKKFDYGNQWGVANGLIWTAAKTEFNGEDFGVIAVDTACTPD